MNGGHVEQAGRPERIYAHPATSFVAGFIGAANILPVEIRPQDHDEVLVTVEAGNGAQSQSIRLPRRPETPSGARFLVLRPEHLRLAGAESSGQQLTAKIESLTFLGATVMVSATIGEWQLRARLIPDNATHLNPGAVVQLIIDAEKAVLVP
jgi:ABC-type sugar transport system ATPase subunit